MNNGTLLFITERRSYMADGTKKNIVLRVDPDFHQKVKIHVAMEGITLKI